MLTRRLGPRIFVAALAVASPARAAVEELRAPQKLTVALSDELLGQLSPDGHTLVFVSNRNATSQIFVQDLGAPASRLLFDEAADVTWPRVSPDGRRLLYVSFRDDAAGRLCVRELPSLARRCLEGDDGALEAAWAGPDELVLLRRRSLHGDLELDSVRVDGGRLRASPLLAKNLNGPAVSPAAAGRRWLAFVPLARVGELIGPAFAAQAGRELVLRPLAGGAELSARFDLPGTTGQPAFSPDGKWLYFTQFLNDTDQNGVIDGDDHGVIFRVPFDAADPGPALARATPEQLTTAAWSCQYPAPSTSRLILTCARAGSLDVYALPADGMVPATWSPERLRDEVQASRDGWERLLLLHRLARATADPNQRAALLAEVLRLHFGLGEYEAAIHHARALGRSAAPSLAPLGPVIEPLIAGRRAMRAFDRGQLGHRFLEDTRRRLEAVLAAKPDELPAAASLRHVVASELYDQVGDKAAAVDELGRAEVDARSPALLVEIKADRTEALYRELDRGDDLVAGLRALVDHPSLSEAERLRLGGVYAQAVALGMGPAAAEAARARERNDSPPASARRFALDLASCLDKVDKATLASGAACVDKLWADHLSPARRRVLVTEVLRRAEDTDADDIEYQLVRRYVRDVPRDGAEHRHAARLYRHVVEDYAYAALAAGQPEAAAAEFDSVAREVDSLESHLGYIEAALAAGRLDVERAAIAPLRADSPLVPFVRAYFEVRRLVELDGADFDRAYPAALVDVRASERAMAQKPEVQALYGALLHLCYLRTGDRAAAEEANTHYLLALDLAAEHARYRAMVLEQLALLHARVGNYRIAVAHFDERAELPFPDPRVELGHHLELARSLFHLGRDVDAARAAEVGLALVDRTASLRRFAALALDRAALYTLAAGDGARALALYDRHAQSTDGAGQRERNRVVRALARAAAALAAGHPELALGDLDAVDQALADPAVRGALAAPHTSLEESNATYDLLRLGLRGQALRALGRHDEAGRALAARHVLLATRAETRKLDDDLLSLSLAEAQLAELARSRRAPKEAAELASQALDHADQYALRTGTPLADAQLAALGFAAELHLTAGVPAGAFRFDLGARLREAFNRLSDAPDPARHDARVRFGVYLTLLGLDRSR